MHILPITYYSVEGAGGAAAPADDGEQPPADAPDVANTTPDSSVDAALNKVFNDKDGRDADEDEYGDGPPPQAKKSAPADDDDTPAKRDSKAKKPKQDNKPAESSDADDDEADGDEQSSRKDTLEADRNRDDDGEVSDEGEAEGDAEEGDEEYEPINAHRTLNLAEEHAEDWEDTPDTVKETINRRIDELETGLTKYQADAQAFNEVREVYEQLAAGGKSIPEAFDHYSNMERTLRSNPRLAFQQIAHSIGTTLEQVAADALNVPVEKRTQAYLTQMNHMQGQNTQLTAQLKQVAKELADMKLEIAQKEYDGFVEKHPRLMKNQGLMKEFETQYVSGAADTLDAAYKKAEKMYPDPNASKASGDEGDAPSERPSAQKARNRRRSSRGSPGRGSNPQGDNTPSKSANDAVSKAFNKLGV